MKEKLLIRFGRLLESSIYRTETIEKGVALMLVEKEPRNQVVAATDDLLNLNQIEEAREVIKNTRDGHR